MRKARSRGHGQQGRFSTPLAPPDPDSEVKIGVPSIGIMSESLMDRKSRPSEKRKSVAPWWCYLPKLDEKGLFLAGRRRFQRVSPVGWAGPAGRMGEEMAMMSKKDRKRETELGTQRNRSHWDGVVPGETKREWAPR